MLFQLSCICSGKVVFDSRLAVVAGFFFAKRRSFGGHFILVIERIRSQECDFFICLSSCKLLT